MGSNRALPFGYKMEFGRIVIFPEEAGWVTYLFDQYLLGASYKRLSDEMNGYGVHYDGEKPWNKNMIARILQDCRYTGEGGFPKIIDSSVYQRSEEKRRKKATAPQKTEVQKILRRKCGCRITAHIEHEVLYLLNHLAAHPERIVTPNPPKAPPQRLKELKSELDELIHQLPVDEERAWAVLQEVAVTMYEAMDPREYETQRMRRVFQKEEPRSELDANLIAANISAVMVDSNGNVKIRLKNDQIIERGE